jgi:uncharacterized protein YutE (UPF0331/DUF86 family)
MEKLSKLAALRREEFLADFTKVESAKHLFQVSVECCLDVSNHIIASERFRAPKNYAESFEILAEQGILPKTFLPTDKIDLTPIYPEGNRDRFVKSQKSKKTSC